MQKGEVVNGYEDKGNVVLFVIEEVGDEKTTMKSIVYQTYDSDFEWAKEQLEKLKG